MPQDSTERKAEDQELKFNSVTGRIIQKKEPAIWLLTKTGAVRIPKDG